MYYTKLLVTTSAVQIFDLHLFIRLRWAYVASLSPGSCLWLLVKNFSQNLTRHYIEIMRNFFSNLERWPRSPSTLAETFLQMFMAPSRVMLGTILCSFMTCQSGQGFHHCFILIFGPFLFCLSRFLQFWGSKFPSVKRGSREPRRIMTIWGHGALHGTSAEGADVVSRAGTRWGAWWLLHSE
jgi:hypothetical protein